MNFPITIDLTEEELKILMSATYCDKDDTFFLDSRSKYPEKEFDSLLKRHLIIYESDSCNSYSWYELSWVARVILNR